MALTLTPQQRAALAAGDRKRVIASAGTGKTALLTAQAEAWADDASNMACMTFTRRAADELRNRLADRDVHPHFVGTVHSFCFLALWRWGHKYTLMDEAELELVADYVLALHNMKTASTPKRLVKALIGERSVKLAATEETARQQVRSYMRANGLLYVGDVPYRWLDLFDKEPRFREWMRSQARAVLWDEYQDTNHHDSKILEALAPDKVLVIGDPSQAIYGFRGSSATYLLSADMPMLPLTINWRSGSSIVEYGNRFRMMFQATPGRTHAGATRSHACDLEGVGRRVAAIAAHTKPLHVLCRTNIEIRQVADAVEECSDLRVWVVSSKYDRFSAFHWRAVFVVCQWLCNRGRRWLQYRVEQIAERAGVTLPDDWQPTTAFEVAQRLNMIPVTDADRLAVSPFEFVRWYQCRDLQDQLPTEDHEAPDVVVMTVHAAKGLEFDHVAVLAHHMPLRGQDADEERNIYYVAVTRARETMVVLTDDESKWGAA